MKPLNSLALALGHFGRCRRGPCVRHPFPACTRPRLGTAPIGADSEKKSSPHGVILVSTAH
jgi:hypothetical protein